MIGQTRKRPHEMSTEELLDRSPASPVLGGTMGFFEPIRTDLTLGEDYVLIPPGVWDILYELYGGGPPLPRMVLPPKSSHDASMTIPSEAAISSPQLLSIPKGLSVATHPWVLQSHVRSLHIVLPFVSLGAFYFSCSQHYSDLIFSLCTVMRSSPTIPPG
jgi:hypothetical protein